MSRTPILVRDAAPDDAPSLLLVWADLFRRGAIDRLSRPPLAEARASVARTNADPERRLVVALLETEIVGAAFFMRAPVSPVHAEEAVHITQLQVVEHARKHGVGRALVNAAVEWAEEKGTLSVLAAAQAQSRDANRFFARLGFAQLAVIRAASVASLRGGTIPVEPPGCARTDVRTSRTVGQVLAQRRYQRRVKANAQ